jgi:hypothetical protein
MAVSLAETKGGVPKHLDYYIRNKRPRERESYVYHVTDYIFICTKTTTTTTMINSLSIAVFIGSNKKIDRIETGKKTLTPLAVSIAVSQTTYMTIDVWELNMTTRKSMQVFHPFFLSSLLLDRLTISGP